MEFRDDELEHFATHGAAPVPVAGEQGHVEHDGAHIWYASFGVGPAVILLHGGLGHGGNWGYQVPALLEAGYQAVLIDSRGHGRSSRDEQPYRYDRMAGDVLAVMDRLQLERAALVGWSDGACIALILADKAPERVAGVFFFACNMDPGGTKETAAERGARPLLRAPPAGLCRAIADAGPVRTFRCRGYPDDEDPAELHRAGTLPALAYLSSFRRASMRSSSARPR